MTEIDLYWTDGHLTGFSASDHTGYAEEGEDILCAAISAITQTALLGLADGLHINTQVKMDEAKGYLSVALPENLSQQLRREAHVILLTMKLGLESLTIDYANYLRLHEHFDFD